jgi:predicted O-methyltransferase YrrM
MFSPRINPNQDFALRRVRSVIERMILNGKVVARTDYSVHEIFPISISSVQGEVLRKWVVKEAAAHTIEIGLAWGIGALHICEGLLMTGNEDLNHVALDPFQATGFKNCGLEALDDAGVRDLISHYAEESQIALPRFVGEGRHFDFAFVDGSHLFDRVFLDLIYLERLVKPGGIIFADDYQTPAVSRAVSFCLSNLGWKVEEMAPDDDQLHQWVVLRTVREPIPRSFPHFVDF